MRTFIPRGADELERAAAVIRGLNPDKPWCIRINPYREKRTTDQNRLLWAIYTEIGKETGNDPEDVHDGMKAKFLPPRHIKIGDIEEIVPAKSSKLDVLEFSEYVDRVQAWAASELGIIV